MRVHPCQACSFFYILLFHPKNFYLSTQYRLCAFLTKKIKNIYGGQHYFSICPDAERRDSIYPPAWAHGARGPKVTCGGVARAQWGLDLLRAQEDGRERERKREIRFFARPFAPRILYVRSLCLAKGLFAFSCLYTHTHTRIYTGHRSNHTCPIAAYIFLFLTISNAFILLFFFVCFCIWPLRGVYPQHDKLFTRVRIASAAGL